MIASAAASGWVAIALNPKSSFHIGPGFHGVLLSFLSDCKRLTKAWLRPKGFVEAWKYLKGNDIVAAALSGGGLAANSPLTQRLIAARPKANKGVRDNCPLTPLPGWRKLELSPQPLFQFRVLSFGLLEESWCG